MHTPDFNWRVDGSSGFVWVQRWWHMHRQLSWHHPLSPPPTCCSSQPAGEQWNCCLLSHQRINVLIRWTLCCQQLNQQSDFGGELAIHCWYSFSSFFIQFILFWELSFMCLLKCHVILFGTTSQFITLFGILYFLEFILSSVKEILVAYFLHSTTFNLIFFLLFLVGILEREREFVFLDLL